MKRSTINIIQARIDEREAEAAHADGKRDLFHYLEGFHIGMLLALTIAAQTDGIEEDEQEQTN